MEIWEADQKQVINKEKLVLRLRDEGETYREIRDQTGLGLAIIRRIIYERDSLIEESEAAEALTK